MSENTVSPGALRVRESANIKTPRQRFGGIGFVAGIHAVAIYALLSALGVVAVPQPARHLTIVNLVEQSRHDELPLPKAPDFQAPPVEPMIAPVVMLDYIPAQSTAITTGPVAAPHVPQPVAAVVPAPPPPPVQEPAFVPPLEIAETHTIPDYPPVSRRLHEHGTLHLKLTISDVGIVANAAVLDSSGFQRLDDAAIAWIKANWRYRPAREGARPVTAVIEAEVKFVLL